MAAADIHDHVAEVYGGDIFSHRTGKSEVQNLAEECRHTCVGPEEEREEEEKKQNKTKNQCLKQVLNQINDLLPGESDVVSMIALGSILIVKSFIFG